MVLAAFPRALSKNLCHSPVPSGPVRPAEAVPGLVSAAVPVHPRQPVPALRPHTLHLWRGPSFQRGAQLRHLAALGHHWVAAHHLHGELREPDPKVSHVIAWDLFPCGEGGNLLMLEAAGEVGFRYLLAGLKERVAEQWLGRQPLFCALDFSPGSATHWILWVLLSQHKPHLLAFSLSCFYFMFMACLQGVGPLLSRWGAESACNEMPRYSLVGFHALRLACPPLSHPGLAACSACQAEQKLPRKWLLLCP